MSGVLVFHVLTLRELCVRVNPKRASTPKTHDFNR